MSSLTGRHWCPGCADVCPGRDADGFCLLADRAELERRRASHFGRCPDNDAAPAPIIEPVKLRATDPGFWRYEVLLDGIRQERVWRADAAEGLVEVMALNARRIVTGERLTLRGRVEIRLRAGAQPVIPEPVAPAPTFSAAPLPPSTPVKKPAKPAKPKQRSLFDVLSS